MKKQVLFIQGAGAGAYEEDNLLAESLQHALGADYDVNFPQMPDEDNAPYELWKRTIEKQLLAMQKPVVLVGHSAGGSYLAKILTEVDFKEYVAGVSLISAPFWGGEGWLYDGYEELELPANAASRVPADAKIFLYHSRDDETVPFTHLALYAKLFTQATVRALAEGGHQVNNDLTVVADDILSEIEWR